MIHLVCPDCKKGSERAKTRITIEASGSMRVAACRDGGVERAVSSPLRALGEITKADIVTRDGYICTKCGKENPVEKWKYNVTCDHCGRLITKGPVKDPTSIVDEHVCRDTVTIYCDRCWDGYNKEYCSECRFSDDCSSHNNR